MLCKAVIKYAEGPGEIDSLVNKLCDTLASLSLAMKDAHQRALAEEEELEAREETRLRILARAPLPLLEQAIMEIAKEKGYDLEPEDWSELEDISY